MNVYDIEYPQIYHPDLVQWAKDTKCKVLYNAYRLKKMLLEDETEIHPEYIGKPIVSIGGGIASTLLVPLYLRSQGIDALYIYCAVDNDDQTLIETVEAKLGLNILRLNPVGNVMPKAWRGFNIWDVYFAVGYLGNWQADPCSRVLKREAILKFMQAHKTPSVYLGISADEGSRWISIIGNYKRIGIEARAPLYEYPDCFNGVSEIDLCQQYLGYVPDAYTEGMTHNNCGGFCIKAGLGQLQRGYYHNLEYYLDNARLEEMWNYYWQFDQEFTIFRKSQKGKRQPISMRKLIEIFKKNLDGRMFEPYEATTPSCSWCD